MKFSKPLVVCALSLAVFPHLVLAADSHLQFNWDVEDPLHRGTEYIGFPSDESVRGFTFDFKGGNFSGVSERHYGKLSMAHTYNGSLDPETQQLQGTFNGSGQNSGANNTDGTPSLWQVTFSGSFSTSRVRSSPGDTDVITKTTKYAEWTGPATIIFSKVNCSRLYEGDSQACPVEQKTYAGKVLVRADSQSLKNIPESGSQKSNTGSDENSVKTSKTPSQKESGQAVNDEEANSALDFLNTAVAGNIDQAVFRELIAKYRENIAIGEYGKGDLPEPFNTLGIKPGAVNNLLNGANETACGGYQGSVLKFLLALKFSDNAEDRALLENFDFGPIQIEEGGHQAVVIFPKDTDWKLSGIVLDPWPEQKPKLYNIEEWQGMFAGGVTQPEGSVGNVLTPIKVNSGYFPTTPSPDGKWEYKNIYSGKVTLPEKYQKLKEQRDALEKTKNKVLTVGSPVLPLVRSSDGKEIGMKGVALFVNDFGPGADVSIFKKRDGTYASTFVLPDGDYAVSLAAVGDGNVHVFNHLMGNPVFAFDTVAVSRGAKLNMDWSKLKEAADLKDQGGNVVKSNELSPPGYSKYAIVFYAVVVLAVSILFLKWWTRP